MNSLEQLRLEVEQNKESNVKARRVLLDGDPSTNVNDYIQKLSYVSNVDETLIYALKGIVENIELPSDTRISALEKLIDCIAENEDLLNWLFSIISATQETDELREFGLELLQRISFGSSALQSQRPAYTAVLKQLVTDKNLSLAGSALTTLATNKDPEAQSILIDGIRNPGRSLVPVSRAIQLLGTDVKGGHKAVIEEALQSALGTTEPVNSDFRFNLKNAMPPKENNKVIIEALYALAADNDHSGLIAGIAADKALTRDVRTNAINLIKAPAELAGLAKQIIDDPEEDTQIQLSCMNALLHNSDAPFLYEDVDLNRTVQRIAAKSVLFRNASEKYFQQQNLSLDSDMEMGV